MCGIYFSTKLDIKESIVKRELTYRGADCYSSQKYKNNYFAHALLARTDAIAKSKQPFTYKNLTILFSGELYNHLEIRASLDYQFTSQTDTETLAVAFDLYGSSLFDKIRGMYAIIVFDDITNSLYVSRDSFGIKPLYYTLNHEITFSSALSLFKTQHIKNTIRTELVQYGWNFGNDTIKENVFSFPTTECWEINIDSGDIIQRNKKIIKNRPNTLKKAILESFKEQSNNSLPQGILFSGGIDSTLLALSAKELGLSIPLYTFDFKGNQKKYGYSDDLTYAKKISDHLEMELRIVSFDDNDFEMYKEQLATLNEPYLDLAAFSLHQICKKANTDGIKILFNGLGPDEFWGGYRRHQFAKKVSTIFFLKRSNWIQGILMNLILTGRVKLASFKSPHFKGRSFLDKMLNFDQQEYLTNNNLKYAEAIGLLHNIETRFPFLTNEIASFTKDKKQDTWFNKKALKEILLDYLPKEFIDRPKSGFALPSKALKINRQQFRQEVLRSWLLKHL